MRGIPLEELRPKVTRGFYITKREPNVTDSTESTVDVQTSTEMTEVTDSESSDASILNETNPEKTPEISTHETESAESADRSDQTSSAETSTTESRRTETSPTERLTESRPTETSPTESRRTETSPTERLTETSPTERPTESRRTETSPTERLTESRPTETSPTESRRTETSPTESRPTETSSTEHLTTEEVTTESTTVLKLNTETDEPSTVPATVKDNIRQQKFGFGERSQRTRQRGGESVTAGRRRVFVGRRRISTTTSKPIEEVTVKNKSTGNDRESLNEDGTDRIEAEVNSSKNTSAQSPGSLLSTRLRKPVSTQQSKSSNTFTNHRKNRPTGGEHSSESEKHDAVDKTTETAKVEKEIDQSSRAQEIAVTLADPPPQSSTTGRPALRNAFRRKISTTIAPRSDATTTTKSFTPALRGRPRSKDKPVQNATTRPRRPQVIDYDYYEDEEESVIGKSTLNGKLFLTSKGSIRCLDQGNFPHPYSCRKFITCARMVNGLVVGAEYTCPDKLSFDPVGGICNWSAGLGCKD